MDTETSTAFDELLKSIQTFGNIAGNRENREKMWEYNNALMESLRSIVEDNEADTDTKLKVLDTTLAEFTDAMKDLFPKLLAQNVPASPDRAEAAVVKTDTEGYDYIEEM